MKIVVTGSSSCLAQAVLPRLCDAPGVTSVTGVDARPPRYKHGKFRSLTLDIRDPALIEALENQDALVHLAFVVLRGRTSEAEMFDINVNAGHKLFHAARRSRVKRLVFVSSAAVYGGGVHLDETAPLAPHPEFLYARHKAHLERLLEIEFPESVRLRPHVILGPNAQPLLRRLLNQPFYPRLPDPHPLLQCVHEDDVAEAVWLALACDAHGPYNLAVEDSFSFRDAIRARHQLRIPLPLAVAKSSVELAWRLFGWGGEPAWVDGLARNLMINCRRAAVDLGWRSRHTAAEVLAAT